MAPLASIRNRDPNSSIQLIAAILAFGCLILAGYALRHTLSCFLLSFVIAYLLDPIVVKMEQRSLRRIHAITLLYIVLGTISAFSFMFLLPMLTISWDSFLAGLPQNIQKIKLALTDWQHRLPPHYGSEEITWLLDTAIANADSAVQKAGVWAYGFATKIFFNVFNLVLAPILVFFMLSYKQKIRETATLWLPDNRRELILLIGREVDSSVGGYIKGQVIVSIVVSVVTIPVLLALGIPHPILCGIFAGMASIIPFIGVLLAMLPPLLFAWLAYGTGAIIIKVLAAFSVIYFFEGYLIKPLVFKESMNLNPLLTIIMVMAFGEVMGFWGILLALPITAALIITSQHWLKGDFSNPCNEP